MKTRPIGRTGLRVTEISFGCASIGNLYREVSDAEAAEVLEAAWRTGIRYFDTAPHYGRGLSEERLGRFLAGRVGVVLSTKVGRVLAPAASPDCVDTNLTVTPMRSFVHGGQHETMLLRACFKYRPISPGGALASSMYKDDEGYTALVATSAFVHEPL